MLTDSEMELADDRVPAGIMGGDVFRDNVGQMVNPNLWAVVVSFGASAMRSSVSYP